jgi:integrase
MEDGGCNHCHIDAYSCDDGFFMVKRGTEGVGREVPVWEEWIDYHKGESRPTELPKWLDHYFSVNDSFGISVGYFQKVVKQVAERRHDIIADHHEGEVERRMGTERKVVPDIKPHDLRATWATQCLRAGIEDEQLMDWAGWKSRQMIDRYRSKLNDPSGENTKKYAKGRGGEGMSSADKIAKLKEMGLMKDGEKLSAEELAELEGILH